MPVLSLLLILPTFLSLFSLLLLLPTLFIFYNFLLLRLLFSLYLFLPKLLLSPKLSKKKVYRSSLTLIYFVPSIYLICSLGFLKNGMLFIFFRFEPDLHILKKIAIFLQFHVYPHQMGTALKF